VLGRGERSLGRPRPRSDLVTPHVIFMRANGTPETTVPMERSMRGRLFRGVDAIEALPESDRAEVLEQLVKRASESGPNASTTP